MRNFKKIQAWERGHALDIAFQKATVGFARKGHSYLRRQLTHAAESVRSNIVEGCGASTNKEFARFLEMSIKSANEVEGHLRTVLDLHLLPESTCLRLMAETVEVRKMTYTYRKRVLEDPDA